MLENLVKGPVFICAGEPSGDLYASLLIQSNVAASFMTLIGKRNKKQAPNIEIYGVGGREMARAGVKIIYDDKDLMTLGFTSGILSSFRNYKIYTKIAQALYKIRPKTFIAVAYPGINLLLCRYAKKLGIKVLYLLPPQIWAWGDFRKYFIKKWVDLVVSVFPFECKFYKRTGIKTDYLENPLIRELKKYQRNDFNKRIGFMPGSRISEIKRNFPVMSEIIKNLGKVSQSLHNIEYSFILHPDTLADNVFNHLTNYHLTKKLQLPNPNLITTTENRYQAMCNCDLLITCSGTASLEAAIMGIPQIFFNRPSFFDYHFVRRFLKIKEFNLANLYFEKTIVPGFISRNTALLKKDIYDQIFKVLHFYGTVSNELGNYIVNKSR